MKWKRLIFLLFQCLIFCQILSYSWPWKGEFHWKVRIPSKCNLKALLSRDFFLDSTLYTSHFNCNTLQDEFISKLFKTATEVEKFHPILANKFLQMIQVVYKALVLSSDDPLHTIVSTLQKELKQSNGIEFSFSLLYRCYHEESNQKTVESVVDKLSQFCAFAMKIIDSIENPRKLLLNSIARKNSTQEAIKVLVVGGGPVGLISAIEAYKRGGDVEVVEKRGEYRRNTWFDLEPPPWSNSLTTLRSWGLSFQSIEHVIHSGVPDVITLRTQNLERFLSKVVVLLNISVHYQKEFVTFCAPQYEKEKWFAVMKNKNNSSEWPWKERQQENICSVILSKESELQNNKSIFIREFDVIVGCDGTKSSVREAAGIAWIPQTEFQLVTADDVTENVGNTKSVPHLHQTALLLNFKTENGECPHLKKDKDGNILDPRYPTFLIEGVNSVWKRFYLNHCQLQILFNNSMGKEVITHYKAKRNYRPKTSNGNNWPFRGMFLFKFVIYSLKENIPT